MFEGELQGLFNAASRRFVDVNENEIAEQLFLNLSRPLFATSNDVTHDKVKVRVWVDGSPVAGLSSLDNESGQIDYVRWGAVDGVDSTTSGTMKLDEFVSQRSSSMIGTLP